MSNRILKPIPKNPEEISQEQIKINVKDSAIKIEKST